MTPRERLLAVLSGKPVDKTPAWLLFPYHSTSYYVDVRTHPAYRPVAERSLTDAITLNRRSFGVSLFSPDVKPFDTTYNENGDTVRRTGWRSGTIELYSETRTGESGTRVKRMLETDADLDQ